MRRLLRILCISIIVISYINPIVYAIEETTSEWINESIERLKNTDEFKDWIFDDLSEPMSCYEYAYFISRAKELITGKGIEYQNNNQFVFGLDGKYISKMNSIGRFSMNMHWFNLREESVSSEVAIAGIVRTFSKELKFTYGNIGSTQNFSDHDKISKNYLEEIYFAKRNEMIEGDSLNNFLPNSYVTKELVFYLVDGVLLEHANEYYGTDIDYMFDRYNSYIHEINEYNGIFRYRNSDVVGILNEKYGSKYSNGHCSGMAAYVANDYLQFDDEVKLVNQIDRYHKKYGSFSEDEYLYINSGHGEIATIKGLDLIDNLLSKGSVIFSVADKSSDVDECTERYKVFYHGNIEILDDKLKIGYTVEDYIDELIEQYNHSITIIDKLIINDSPSDLKEYYVVYDCNNIGEIKKAFISSDGESFELTVSSNDYAKHNIHYRFHRVVKYYNDGYAITVTIKNTLNDKEVTVTKDFLRTSIGVSNIAEKANILYDDASVWAKSNIDLLRNTGEYKDEFFSSYNAPLTREEFAYFAVRSYEYLYNKFVLLKDSSKYTFQDIDSIYTQKVNFLDIMNGSNNQFRPDNIVTREQAAVMLVKIFSEYYAIGNTDKLDFNYEAFKDDEAISSWAKRYVYIAKKFNILNGVGDNYFRPKDYFTKEQFMYIVAEKAKKMRSIEEKFKPQYGNYTDFVHAISEQKLPFLYSNEEITEIRNKTYNLNEGGSCAGISAYLINETLFDDDLMNTIEKINNYNKKYENMYKLELDSIEHQIFNSTSYFGNLTDVLDDKLSRSLVFYSLAVPENAKNDDTYYSDEIYGNKDMLNDFSPHLGIIHNYIISELDTFSHAINIIDKVVSARGEVRYIIYDSNSPYQLLIAHNPLPNKLVIPGIGESKNELLFSKYIVNKDILYQDNGYTVAVSVTNENNDEYIQIVRKYYYGVISIAENEGM